MSGEWLGRIHKVELPRHLTRAEADTLVTSCISEGVSASVSAEYNTPKFVDNPKYVLAPMMKSHTLAVLQNNLKISYVMLFQYVLARQSCMYVHSVIIVSKGIHDGPCLCNIPVVNSSQFSSNPYTRVLTSMKTAISGTAYR